VTEDQVVEGVGVMQPTCTIIHDECVGGSKEEPTVKDESLSTTPHLLHLDIPCDFSTADFPFENPFLDVSTCNHSQDTSNVSLSSQCGEDTSPSANPSNLSSIFSENTKGEHLCFSSTPLPDSLNHEDDKKHPKFFDLGFHDLYFFI